MDDLLNEDLFAKLDINKMEEEIKREQAYQEYQRKMLESQLAAQAQITSPHDSLAQAKVMQLEYENQALMQQIKHLQYTINNLQNSHISNLQSQPTKQPEVWDPLNNPFKGPTKINTTLYDKLKKEL